MSMSRRNNMKDDNIKDEHIGEAIDLRKSHNYLKIILDNSWESIVITNSNGFITQINKSFAELLGQHEEEIIGKHINELTPCKEGIYESRNKESVEISKNFINYIKTCLSKLSEEGKILNMKSYYIDKNNQVIPIESNTVYLYNDSGAATGAVSIIRNNTDKEKKEKEILEARNLIENILNLSTDGIMIADRLGRVLRVNRALEQMLGYREDELMGKYTTELGPQENNQLKERMMAQLFEKGHVTNWKTTWYKKDGSLSHVEINIAFLKDQEGNPFGAVASIRNLTDKN